MVSLTQRLLAWFASNIKPSDCRSDDHAVYVPVTKSVAFAAYQLFYRQYGSEKYAASLLVKVVRAPNGVCWRNTCSTSFARHTFTAKMLSAV
ncbi:hypothetical protein DJICPGNB_25590 [Escherichia coli]|nr:hypothetical protein DJICPGNB_25590 [Escherichia coli]